LQVKGRRHAALLSSGGSLGQQAVTLIEVPIIGILAPVALPAYQDYIKRAKVRNRPRRVGVSNRDH
jgi:hypothetical protein